MSHSVSIYEAKTQLSNLLREVEAGQVVTITRHGKPVAELHPSALAGKQAMRGSGKSPGFYMAQDFDAPLDVFADYMPEADAAGITDATGESDSLRVAEDAPPARPKRR